MRAKAKKSKDKIERIELHYAVNENNLDKVKELIASGEDVNLQDSAGGTPLHFAA